MAQHKWHDEIVAWAKGAEIEWLSGNEWLPKIHEHWNVHLEYRIKPHPKEPQYLYVYNHESYGLSISVEKRDVEDSDEVILGKIKLEEE